MPETIREKIIKNVCVLMDADYGDDLPTDEDRLPATVVKDDLDTVITGAYDYQVATMPIEVRTAAIARSEKVDEMRAEAHELQGQLIKKMQADETILGFAEKIEYTGGGPVIEGRYVAAICSFEITYNFLRGDPYSQE